MLDPTTAQDVRQANQAAGVDQASAAIRAACVAEQIRVRGTVQGVGLRPTVWRIAQALGVRGSVANDAAGVLIVAVAPAAVLDQLAQRLRGEAPPLARIEAIERQRIALDDAAQASGASSSASRSASMLPPDFLIVASAPGPLHTQVAADAAICAACVAEILDPFARRYRYALAGCTHCGPRLSYITGMPYDRPRTTLAEYPLCAACRDEYDAPASRHFHAQGMAHRPAGVSFALSGWLFWLAFRRRSR